ncbi:MAG: phosphate acyltransferase PlsX [Lachnospiraceae bacterium]|nr:phosphate acyltransferase PlsX [Lachnospiraceae bacterium]MEE3460393.1 phosphate acyltransferase PlsX [Lachnospiraceae bacterium]
MGELITIALDGMGGDNAPEATVQGAVMALKKSDKIFIKMTGKKEVLDEELKKYEGTYDDGRLEIINASETIGFDEQPVMAVRKKKDSSLVKGMRLVKTGDADAFVSAGSTGAILVGGQMIVGRIKGIDRSPLAPLFPTLKGNSLLIDCGANMDARPEWLLQFAVMGTIYMREIVGKENPTVAIVNVGAEEEKGNKLVHETYPLLKECRDINFIGSIEGKEIPEGAADIIVCDAFTGNVILKLYEGLAKTIFKILKKAMLSNLRSKIGALLLKPSLKKEISAFKVDASDVGGAPMLGLTGLVIKAHGSSDAKEIMNACLQCVPFTEHNVNAKIREFLDEQRTEE